MGKLFMIAMLVVVGGLAGAQDLGNQAPAKVPGVYPVNIPDPDRQGGDTLLDAVIIPTLPFADTGTTAGYTDDYTSTCFFAGGAPDVVYQYTVAPGVEGLDISLCGSSYDSGLYVYDSGLNEVACNDDYCGTQSQLDNVYAAAGQTYYIIVDGYSAAFGDYVINVDVHVPCVVTCPDDAWSEGEPPLVDDYVDNWNGGCNTTPNHPFQHIEHCYLYGPVENLCGESGWYLSAGSQLRDTDWFTLSKDSANIDIVVTADAEYASYIFELNGTCAGGVTVVQQDIAGPCLPATMSIPGPAGTHWFWVGPTVFADPDGGDNTYDYVLWITGLRSECCATEPSSWSNVKALYR
jgi:hypothetical protein